MSDDPTAAYTKEQLASELNGAAYPLRPDRQIIERAKRAGLVIIYGASDDLMEFDGAFQDEIGCYNGGTAYLDASGVLCREQIDDDDDEAIVDFVSRRRLARTVEALWCAEPGYSWTYRTTLPHATFEITDEGEPYCRGIIIDTADLK